TDTLAAEDVDALGTMRVMNNGGDFSGNAPHQNPGLRFDDCDIRAELAGGGGEFQTDEPAADDGDAAARPDTGANREGVIEGAKIDAMPAFADERQAAGYCARRQQELVI